MNYEDLIVQIKPKLKAITYKLDGRFTCFNDEDLYQEACVYLWQHCNEHKFDDKTESYILQGCYFFLKNYIRKIYTRLDARTARLDDYANGENSYSLKDIVFSGDKNSFLGTVNVHVAIHDIFDCLVKRERCVLNLCLDGFTTREIGRKLSISHVMVIKIIAKIRKKCRHLVSEFIFV